MTPLPFFVAALLSPAHAAGPAPAAMSPLDVSSSGDTPVDTAADTATPRRLHQRPSIPRGQTDFTAYTLEWGEVRIGLGGVGVGIFPRTQVATMPVLDALGVPNASLKLNAVRAGGFDLAVNGTWGGVLEGPMDASWLSVGGAASLQVAKPVSLHVGGSWVHAKAAGTPQLDALATLMGGSGVPSRATVSALEEQLSFEAEVTGVTARAATDVRLNRRDSIVVQAQAVVWASTELPPFMERLTGEYDGAVPLEDAYTASIAWQLSWRNVDARVGVGVSSVPGAWLLNTVDLAYRFGGPTRTAERKAARIARDQADDARDVVPPVREERTASR